MKVEKKKKKEEEEKSFLTAGPTEVKTDCILNEKWMLW
jgi:hypothetical protein